MKMAKIETCCWYNEKRPQHRRGYELRPTNGRHRLWNTRLSEQVFDLTVDGTDYDHL